MRVYWYAPFNNAGEQLLAQALSRNADVELTFHTVRGRFGREIDLRGVAYRAVTDLPPPAGEEGRRSLLRRASVAVERAVRRRREINSTDFDVVHLHTFNPVTDWAFLHLIRGRSKMLIQSVHNVRPHEGGTPKWFETIVHRLGYMAADVIIVAHETLKDLLVEQFSVPSYKVIVIPLPAMMSPIEYLKNKPASGPINFLFFGTLRENKGLPVLREALRLLEPLVRKNFRIMIAGRGDDKIEKVVYAMANEFSEVTADVSYIEPLKKQSLFAAADCVLLPYTEFAAQSGVLLDAYCFGLPVIASGVGALGRSVAEDRTGWLVSPGDPAELAAAMTAAAAAPDERLFFGCEALKIAHQRAPSSIAEQFMEIYSSVTE